MVHCSCKVCCLKVLITYPNFSSSRDHSEGEAFGGTIRENMNKMHFKAALIDIFITTMDEMTVCKVCERVACRDEQTENNHVTLQFPSA